MCVRLTIGFLTVFALTGCGDERNRSPESSVAISASTGEKAPQTGITADITGRDRLPAEDGSQIGGNEILTNLDPVEKLLAEIQQLQVKAAVSTTPGNGSNEKIVLKATEVIRLTMQDSLRAAEFLEAVRDLLQARLHLAFNGSAADIDRLYADVQALNDRDPNSESAAEGIYYLAKFAHTKARQVREQKADWNVNFSRWAREFAARFPHQTERALSLLFGAGRSCEMTAASANSEEESALLRTEARLCYVMLMETWPKEPHGQEAVAVLRRLELPGHKLSQFSGPALSGGTLSAEQFSGKVTLIYFWDSESHDFTNNWLPLLRKAESQLPVDCIRFIGVNLDESPDRCREAVQELAVPGDQICFRHEKRRGWNSPLVRFWGVSQSPSVWLVGNNGVVDSVDVRRTELASRIKMLVRRSGVSRN
ncbi:MAG: TlpA family protein disulfide reductase [Fuerstiella sp.]|nr:TlpA family protein disulfide reductase [Fuerstiella sp.]